MPCSSLGENAEDRREKGETASTGTGGGERPEAASTRGGEQAEAASTRGGEQAEAAHCQG